MKKKSYYVIALVLGLILFLLATLIKGEELKNVSGILFGIGAGLIGMGIAGLWIKKTEEKNPDICKANEIEAKDERNIMIRYRAKAKAGDMIQWFIMGIAYILIMTNASLWLILVTIGGFLLYNFMFMYFSNKYQKEM